MNEKSYVLIEELMSLHKDMQSIITKLVYLNDEEYYEGSPLSNLAIASDRLGPYVKEVYNYLG